jgi:hypothetical protein
MGFSSAANLLEVARKAGEELRPTAMSSLLLLQCLRAGRAAIWETAALSTGEQPGYVSLAFLVVARIGRDTCTGSEDYSDWPAAFSPQGHGRGTGRGPGPGGAARAEALPPGQQRRRSAAPDGGKQRQVARARRRCRRWRWWGEQLGQYATGGVAHGAQKLEVSRQALAALRIQHRSCSPVCCE